MRLIMHSSKWGNMYRHRYYKDGRRITKEVYDNLLADMVNPTYSYEGDVTWYRTTYTVKE